MHTKRTKLQTVVLAGGFGTRLSPLTDSKPKPLVKVLDKTVLETVLERVKKTNTGKVTVSTHYKSEMIEEACKGIDKSIECKREVAALGTAGGVKNCYDGMSDNLLVVSGDGIFDFDLQKAIDFHIERGNDVTIVTCRKQDPTEYGVVICDENGNVMQFTEKPSWSGVKSNLVNTGIYILSKTAVERIPDNIVYDFSNNLFPKLLSESAKIGSFECDGFWCDIGTLDEYYNCQKLAASGKIKLDSNNAENTKLLSEKGIHAEENVYISKGTYIGKNVSISDASVVLSETCIHDSCDISGAVVGNGCRISEGTSITCAIVGDNVVIGENCVIPCGCVIGDGCRIGEGTVMKKGRRIKPYSFVSGEDKMNVEFSNVRCVFVSDGLAVIDRQNPVSCISDFARALSLAYKKSNKRNSRIAVMTDERIKAVKGYFISGLEHENTDIFDLGKGNEALCRYACSVVCVDAAVFVSADERKLYFTLFSQTGEYIDNKDERKILKIMSDLSENTDYETMCNRECQTINVPIYEMYAAALMAGAEKILGGADFSGTEISLKSGSNISGLCFERVFESLSGRLVSSSFVASMTAEFTHDGQGVTVKSSDVVLDENHVLAVVLNNIDILGISDVRYTKNMAGVLKSMLKNSNMSEKKASDVMSNLLCDGTGALILLLCVMTLKGETLTELVRDLPRFAVFTDEYIADVNRGETMERLSKLYRNTKDSEGDGIHLSLPDGNVTVIPNRAKGFKIISEAQSMEAARELSLKIGKAIKG